jgi:serine/threonine-protein kinase
VEADGTEKTVSPDAVPTQTDKAHAISRSDTHLEHTHDVAAKVVASLEAEKPADTKDTLLGRVIADRFEIVSRIGSGGMGAVYKARQVGMDRHVAIKVLLRELAHDEKVARRFKIEALAVSRLTHPNTIRIYDFGQLDDGLLYFAMEFLEGISLERARRRDGPMSVTRVLHVVRQIADSLTEAHGKGIVHRDLKPDNIYLSPVGGDPDFVKVLDFGVAKLREADQRQGTLTQAGVIFGTPRYMAPEQCRSLPVDHRADLYSVGVLAYEMLTGRPPFDAENPLSILIQHVQEPPPPMAEARPDIEVPAEVEAFVLKALEKSPDRRFQTAIDVSQEAARLAAGVEGQYRKVVFVTGPRRPTVTADRSESRTVMDTAHVSVEPVNEEKRPGHGRVIGFVTGGLGVAGATVAVLWGLGVFSPPPEAVPVAEPTKPVATTEAPKTVETPTTVVPATPARVTVQFRSEPAGAEVRDGADVLGTTPFSRDFESRPGTRQFLFRLQGFKDSVGSTSFDRNGEVAVVLVKAPAATPGRKTPTPTSTPTPTPTPVPRKDDGPGKVSDLKGM